MSQQPQPVFCVYAHVMREESDHLGSWRESCDRDGKLIRSRERKSPAVFNDEIKAAKFSLKCDGHRHLVMHCGFRDKHSWRGFRPGEERLATKTAKEILRQSEEPQLELK